MFKGWIRYKNIYFLNFYLFFNIISIATTQPMSGLSDKLYIRNIRTPVFNKIKSFSELQLLHFLFIF